MTGILGEDGQRAFVAELARPQSLVMPFHGVPYVAVVWASDSDPWDVPAQAEVATALIKSGCRYLVCGGVNCEQWHDVADEVAVMLELESVMTTWHAGETESEALQFALNCTNFEGHQFDDFPILVAGCDPAIHGRIVALLTSALMPSGDSRVSL